MRGLGGAPGGRPRVRLETRPDVHLLASGRTMLVCDRHGWIRGGEHGYFFESTRFLSRDQLEVTGEPLVPSGVGTVARDALVGHYLATSEGYPQSRPLYVTLERFVGSGLVTSLRVSNYARDRAYRIELVLHLDADFADTTEVESGSRRQMAEVDRSWDHERRELRFRYLHPDLDRETVVRVAQGPDGVRWQDGALRIAVSVHPRDQEEILLRIHPVVDGRELPAPAASFVRPTGDLARVRERLRVEAPRLATPVTAVAQAWDTAVEDLASLPVGHEEGPAAPSAGLPLFAEFFGRDSLTIAWQALLAMPSMMADTLRANAATRGRTIDDFHDEEPGKLVNHVHRGPLSLLRKDPFLHYHGDYAAASDFLIGFGQYLAWTGDRRTARELLPAVREVLEWTERYADLDGDGFLEYVVRSPSPEAVENQGWKDSPEAIVDARGEVVDDPIATCEVQGYLYVGLRQTAQAFLVLGERGYALDLLRRARRLKRRFDERFWMAEEGFYALALGPDGRPVRSITSNPGHLLAAGIVPRERAHRVVRRLMRPDMFSGYGVRTLSSEHPAYNPFSYHLGSVWPVENATIALGMARYGFWEEAQRVAEGTFAASALFADGRLPEVLGGLPRDAQHPHPGLYPHANAPQGWSASAVIMMVQVLLGLRPFAPLRTVLVDPHLPPWLPSLSLEGVSVGGSRLDLEAWRDRNGATRFRASGRGGRLVTVRAAPRLAG